jgi:hypothetical protein
MTSISDPQNKALAQSKLEAKRDQNPLNSKSKHLVCGNDFASLNGHLAKASRPSDYIHFLN